ncbi:MAG TPA: PVC-type heme-binding CxxCH protein [Methylomirabilota bacterium]|nr:PVC-type heme-binding CxxCH protein [Methylomirabilota bacterium]
MHPLKFIALAAALSASVYAAELGGPAASKPATTNAWAEAETAIKRFRIPQGFKMEVFAVEPQLANPVALSVDERGRVFVAETHRYRTSVLDIRHYMSWYDDDLAARTVDDRIAMVKKHMGNDAPKLIGETELVRLVEDTNGDGRADSSKVFADGFTTMLDGIASGVLARRDQVYFANIPAVTLLTDKNRDGKADARKDLSFGYGVRFSLTGHDLHGLKFGPDGKLYFSVGDRGSHVKSKEGKTYAYPDEGVVYRCDPDGSNLEVFATGLRNPQELVFDEYGNLWTGDNNCDHGDSARLVYIVEGSDTGWRVGFQFSEQNPAGIWNAEGLWKLREQNTGEYLIPPVAHIGNGPSGFLYYPGTGFGDAYKGTFFLCDFRGQATGSGVHSFTVTPKGAGFEMSKPNQFLWDILLTDIDFGPDGKMYMSDWVHGWPKSEKGRIYRLVDAQAQQTGLVRDTQKILAADFTKAKERDLVSLLDHPDMRVRQEAQYRLAQKKSVNALATVAQKNTNQLARIHAIWGLGQLARSSGRAVSALVPISNDRDAEIRAQAIKVLGDAGAKNAFEAAARLTTDSSPRVRMFAGLALAKINRDQGFDAAIAMLRANKDHDVYVRHGAVMALAKKDYEKQLAALTKDSSTSVRLGATLALRRLKSPAVAAYLNDPEPKIVLEAARAINDAAIDEATPALAKAIAKPGTADAVARRAINANFRVGSDETARSLAKFATQAQSSESARAEAVGLLAQWSNPSKRDRVTGLWRPIEGRRDANAATAALTPHLKELLQNSPEAVRIASIDAAEKLGIREAGSLLGAIIADAQAPGAVRARALKALAALKDPALTQALELASADPNDLVRREAQRLQIQGNRGGSPTQLVSVLEKGTIAEKQNALMAMGSVEGSVIDEVVLQQLTKLKAGDIPKEIELDLLEAAAQRPDARVKRSLAELEAAQPKDNPLAAYKATLVGGDKELGRKVFFERAEAACLRCHKVNGEGGEVGPDLTKISAQRDRAYLLESLIAPNAKIAPGFESVVVTLKNGATYAGVLKSETDAVLEINSPEDGLIKVNKADVESRERGLSGMPEGLNLVLSKHDVRNLIEYLSTLK